MTRLLIPTFLFLTLALNGQEPKANYVTDTYHYTLGDISILKMNFEYGIGSLTLKPLRNKREILGSLTYNATQTEPSVTYTINGETGVLNVDVNNPGLEDGVDSDLNFSLNTLKLKPDTKKFQSEIDFLLPTTVPARLDLDFGLGEADLDLSGIPLLGLSVDCGLSQVDISLAEPNPIICDSISLSNGLGDLKAHGLGYANARQLDLDVGLGSAYVDMRGQTSTSIYIQAKVGLGTLNLILPEEANIRVTIESSFLSSVDLSGLQHRGDDEYISREWMSGRPTFNVTLDVGLGSVEVDVRH